MDLTRKSYDKDYYQQNKTRIRANHERWKAKNPDATRDQHLRRRFGITLKDYERLLDMQDGVCAICGEPETVVGRGGVVLPLAVDHDHATGRVRGLLCLRCNRALGSFEARLDDFLAYLASTGVPST